MRKATAGAFMIVLSATSCVQSRAESTGGVVRRDFNTGYFTAVQSEAAPDVIVNIGGPPSVWAEGDSERVAALDIQLQGRTLQIDTRRGAPWPEGRWRAPVVVHVRTPQLSAAAISGSGNINIDTLEGPSFSGRVDGSGNLHVRTLRVGEAAFAVSGSGNIDAAGHAVTLRASSIGSGNATLGGLSANQAEISVAGSGNVRANVTGVADVRVSGSGTAVVTGGAKCSVHKTGSGEIRCG